MKNGKKTKYTSNSQIEAIVQVLEKINELNEIIALHRKHKDNFMLKQYLFMKRDFTKQLLEHLAEYDLPIKLKPFEQILSEEPFLANNGEIKRQDIIEEKAA